MIRLKQVLAEIQVRKFASYSATYLYKVAIGDSVSFIYRMECGLMSGPEAVFWEENPWWAL